MRIFAFIGLTFLCLSAFAAGSPHWGLPSDKTDHRWADFDELKPDFPGAWSVDKLHALGGDEVMLRSAAGAMLRWVRQDQTRVLLDTVHRIEKVAELDVSLYITRGDSPNAAAGKRDDVNIVMVNFAMLDLVGNNADQWAALLGHEVAHLKLNHGSEQAKRNIPLTILKTVAGATIADPLSRTASSFLIDGVGSKFSRDDETQADYMGVIWAVEAHYDAFGAASLHKLMTERTAGALIPFLSSHPSGPERIERLTALAERLTGKQASP